MDLETIMQEIEQLEKEVKNKTYGEIYQKIHEIVESYSKISDKPKRKKDYVKKFNEIQTQNTKSKGF